jgi:hypothetical protein
MRRKDGNYWTEYEDILMGILLDKSTSRKDFNRVYHKLLPTLNHMIKVIHRTYYGGYFLTEDIKTDVITHLIVMGNKKEGKDKFYAYVGTLIKRKLYDIFVSPSIYTARTIKVDTNYDLNENEWVGNGEYIARDTDIDELDMDDKEEIFNRLNEYINQCIRDVEIKIENTPKELVGRIKAKEIEIEWLSCAWNYINTCYFDMGINSFTLIDYLQKNMPHVKKYKIERLSYKFFGIASDGDRMDNRITSQDKKISNSDFSYIQEDYTPSEMAMIKNRRRLIDRNSKTTMKYF